MEIKDLLREEYWGETSTQCCEETKRGLPQPRLRINQAKPSGILVLVIPKWKKQVIIHQRELLHGWSFVLILCCQNFQFGHNCGHMGTVFAELRLGHQLGEKSNKSGTLCVRVGHSAGRGLTYHAGSPRFIPQHKLAVVA